MKRVLKFLGGLVLVVVVVLGGGFVWAKSAAASRLGKTYTPHKVDFPIPFPLTEAEIEALRAEKVAATPVPDPALVDPAAPTPDPLAGVDLAAVAQERAAERGKHLVLARYACVECHGADFGGGTMIDDPAIGTLLGPNLTTGKGGVTATYTAGDWDRIVRHGVKPDGHPAPMPSVDFFRMSDRELSDIVTYIRTLPPVDKTVGPVSLGPVGTVLVATGELLLSAEELPDHAAPHQAEPPDPSAVAAFGEHLAQPCTGCHRPDFSGGPVPGGDPSWPPAANLTPGPDGLAGWTMEDFERAMLEAKSKSGVALRPPMDGMRPYAAAMKAEERAALWTYLSALPAKADGT